MKNFGLLLLILILVSQLSWGQTTLSPGDIMIVTVNADGADNFDFVPLVDLSPGTVITFTDNAWNGTALLTNEGSRIYTASTAVTAGTVISYPGTAGGEWTSSGSYAISGSGDNFLVYQGSSSSPTFLYGIGWAISTPWITSSTPSTNNSYIPPSLSEEANTIVTLGSVDNHQYNTANGTSGTKTELLALLANASYWNGDDATAYSALSATFTISSGSTTTLSVNPSSLSGFTYVEGAGPSTLQSYGISGSNLDGSDVTITAPTDYEISLDDANWFSSRTLTAFDGTSTTVYVRLKADLSAGFYNSETISNSGGGATTQDVTCNGTVNPILPDLVINEILADPDATLGDANGDGIVNSSDDEFIEVINNETSSVDISGWTISDAVSVRHTFPSSTVIPAGESIVVFGGGTPTGIPGIAQVASTGSLGLNNTGDDIVLKDDGGFTATSYTYGSEGGNNQSLARDPDITGSFIEHSTISTNPVLFSAGRRNTDGTALPVELTSFSASIIGSKVKLNWSTATENNNYGFDVLRQAQINKGSWEKVGFVSASGNSNSPSSYSFIDNNVTFGKYSYKLKQIDNDGQFEYSKTVEADLGNPTNYELNQNYPNPFNPTTTISYKLPEASQVKLTVYNILGQEVKVLVDEFKEAGLHTINFKAKDLNSGLYIYKLQAGSFTQTRKMTLIK